MTQEDIQCKGHAVEARIYPENLDTFVPDAGTVSALHLPSGDHIRLESALCTGYSVSLLYEPLVAKVMASGESRDVTVKRLKRAVLAFRLEGVKSNIPLLRDILASREYAGGTYHTGSMTEWVDRRIKRQIHQTSDGSMVSNENEKGDRELAAAIGVAMAQALNEITAAGKPALAPNPWLLYGRRQQLLSRSLESRGWR